MNQTKSRFLLYAMMTVFFLMICVWLAGGRIAKHYLAEWMIRQGAETAVIESLTLNPFALSIELRGLEIQKKGHPPIGLKKAYVDVSIFGLFGKELRISRPDIRGISADIHQKKDRVEIGGFSIPASSDSKSEHKEEKTDSAEWKVGMILGSVSDSSVRVITPELESRVALEKLLIWDTLISPAMVDGACKFSGGINDSRMSLDSRFKVTGREGTASCKVSLKDLELGVFQKLLPDSIPMLTGKLSIASKITAELSQGKIELSLKGEGDVDSLKAESGPFEVANDLAAFQSNMLIVVKEDKFSSASGNASFSSENFRLRDTKSDFTLVTWRETAAEKIGIDFKENLNLDIPSIHTKGLAVSSPPGKPEEHPPLLLAENFFVNHLTVRGNNTGIGSITITDMESSVHLNKEKKIANLPEISTAASPEAPEPDGKPGETVSPDEKQPSGIQIGLFEITGTSRFHFIDDSIDPGFRESFAIERMEIRNLDNQIPDQESPFVLIAGVKEYGKIELQGVVKPFSPSRYVKLDHKIAEYPLPAVSAYSRDVIGHNIQSGQLNAETSLEISGDSLSGKTRIKIDAVNITPHATGTIEKLTKQVTMPLHVAVDYLTDKDGNFELEVPISGSLDDPDFGLSHFFQIILTRAITSAAYGAMKTALLPYGALIRQGDGALMPAGGDLVAVRLEPVIYKIGNALPEIRYDGYIGQLSELMKKEKEVRIILCGFAVPSDVQPTKEAPAGSEEMNRLLLLFAQKRADDFKKILVEKHDIPSARILECHPTVDREEGAQPRLEIEL